MKKYLMLLAATGMLAFTSCKKDNESTPKQTKTQMLTAKTWQLTARTQVTTDSDGNVTTNNTVDNCEKDDTYKFTTDNKVTIDEGATKCDPNDPQSTTGTWALSSNETKLDLTINGFPLSGDLMELTSTKLVVKNTIEIFGDKIVNTSTFTAK